jgi:hypothetical protein
VDRSLQAFINSAAGSGGPTNPSSRYYGFAIEFLSRPDGIQVAYLQRRIIPQPGIYTSVQTHTVADGDRLDNLAASFLGDPILYWMICDANNAMDPDALTEDVGRPVTIPIASSPPSGARNG